MSSLRRRSTTSTSRPAVRPPRPGTTSKRTRSPSSARPASPGGMNTSSPFRSSRATKPNPSRCFLRVPSTVAVRRAPERTAPRREPPGPPRAAEGGPPTRLAAGRAKRLASRRSTPSRARSRRARFTAVRSPGWMRARDIISGTERGFPPALRSSASRVVRRTRCGLGPFGTECTRPDRCAWGSEGAAGGHRSATPDPDVDRTGPACTRVSVQVPGPGSNGGRDTVWTAERLYARPVLSPETARKRILAALAGLEPLPPERVPLATARQGPGRGPDRRRGPPAVRRVHHGWLRLRAADARSARRSPAGGLRGLRRAARGPPAPARALLPRHHRSAAARRAPTPWRSRRRSAGAGGGHLRPAHVVAAGQFVRPRGSDLAARRVGAPRRRARGPRGRRDCSPRWATATSDPPEATRSPSCPRVTS